MPVLLQLPIVFVYTAIVWVVVLVIYNLIFEPFDFGPLKWFAGKSALLVFVISLCQVFIPFGGVAVLIPWWLGLMFVFKKDFWECRILVFLIWGVHFAFS